MTATTTGIGERRPRRDALSKVTGATTYAADFSLPGMLTGRLFRSTVPHARIARLDTSAARKLKGVRAVITAADVPNVLYGPLIQDMPIFASDRVLHIGQPIAAVAAVSAEVAEHALDLIEVEYELLPAVFDVEAALAPDAPCLHPDWASYKANPAISRNGNILSHSRLVNGDVEAAFASAYRTYAHTFTTQMVHAGYMEPRVSVAAWDGESSLTVWTSVQVPFEVQNILSQIFGLPLSNIRVIVPAIGGGFGGKLRIGMEHYAASLAHAARRPVRVMCTTEEELIAAHPRQPATVRIESAVSEDGIILARRGKVLVDTGAYSGSGPGVAAIATQVLAGPYNVQNLLLEGYAVCTNKLPTGSFRAPSGPIGNFAMERHMDMIADDLGIDPLDLRLKNIVEEGSLGPSGEVLTGVSIRECLLKAADAIGWDSRRPENNRGKGIACGWWLASGGSSAVYLRIDPDGCVQLVTGAVELGTAAISGVAQIIAHELTIDLAQVWFAPVDTQVAPFDYGAQGSRTLVAVGNAARVATTDLKRQILAMAAKMLDAPAETLVLRDGHVFASNRQVSIAQVARASQASDGGLVAHGTTFTHPPAHDPNRVFNHVLPTWIMPSFHAHAAELSVDPDTGEISIHRYVIAQDVGKVINPSFIEGQIEGGVAQGLGQALSEELVCENGSILNANLTDYKMMTAPDMPRVESILVENPSIDGPLGAKGVGEPPCIEPPATVANAIASATGLQLLSLPITAERIVLQLKAKNEATA